MFLWSLWSEAGTEETSEESIYLRERMDGREPCFSGPLGCTLASLSLTPGGDLEVM